MKLRKAANPLIWEGGTARCLVFLLDKWLKLLNQLYELWEVLSNDSFHLSIYNSCRTVQVYGLTGLARSTTETQFNRIFYNITISFRNKQLKLLPLYNRYCHRGEAEQSGCLATSSPVGAVIFIQHNNIYMNSCIVAALYYCQMFNSCSNLNHHNAVIRVAWERSLTVWEDTRRGGWINPPKYQ